MAYEPLFEPVPQRSWIFCGGEKGCNRWIQVDINKLGGVKTISMPRNYHFDFEFMPTLVEVR